MTTIALDPFVMTDVDLIFPTDSDYKEHASSVTFTPTANTVTWKGLGGNTFTGAGRATWVVGIDYAQDWETANSLAQRLHASEGEEQEITFKPRSGQGPSFTATVILVPGTIGGAVDTVAVGSVSLPCKGKPQLVPAGGGA